MKKGKEFTRGLALAVMASLIGVTACGCGSNSSSSATAANTSSKAESEGKEEVQKIVIGSGNVYNPYCYVDENGDAVGYEYDVLKEIDELLPQYEFEYKTMAFDQILLSLDAGKIDVAAHQYEKTEERESKYLFGKESYTSYVTYLTVLKDDDATSLEDLAGEKIRAGGATSATSQILKKWNEGHPGKEVEIVNNDSSTDEETVAALKSGAVRATVLKKSDVKKLNNNFSDDGSEWLKSVGDPINNSQTYYLYKTGNTELQEAIDGALKQLKDNGKLSELAIKWVGYDVTESE